MTIGYVIVTPIGICRIAYTSYERAKDTQLYKYVSDKYSNVMIVPIDLDRKFILV